MSQNNNKKPAAKSGNGIIGSQTTKKSQNYRIKNKGQVVKGTALLK
jgi:hypothetical protein